MWQVWFGKNQEGEFVFEIPADKIGSLFASTVEETVVEEEEFEQWADWELLPEVEEEEEEVVTATPSPNSPIIPLATWVVVCLVAGVATNQVLFLVMGFAVFACIVAHIRRGT